MHGNGPHISIKPEVLTHIAGFPLTNSYLTSLIVLVVFFLLASHYQGELKKTHRSTLFYIVHFIMRTLHGFFTTILGKETDRFFTLIGAMFMYILLLDWFGLLPGVGSVLVGVKEGAETVMAPLLRGNTADLNTTFALALVAFAVPQVYGIKYLGAKEYLGKFFNFSSALAFVVGLLELVSEFSRIISYSFRLFGNIFAGEVILSIMAFLFPVLLPFPFLMMEIFVGFIQALVFSMLMAVFINMAITPAHH